MRRRVEIPTVTLKRGLDIVAAALALVVTGPVWIVAAIAVRFTSAGGIFHRATRIGKGGAPFTLLKFRTMHLAPTNEGSGITSADDPRITGVGRVLRRWKVDELPQLVNVLRGEMSLVGPRPEDPRYVAGYTPDQRKVLAVRPGLTSPASIAFRDEEQLLRSHAGERTTFYRDHILPAKLALDLRYIEERSFARDIALLIKTALSLFHGRGAPEVSAPDRR